MKIIVILSLPEAGGGPETAFSDPVTAAELASLTAFQA